MRTNVQVVLALVASAALASSVYAQNPQLAAPFLPGSPVVASGVSDGAKAPEGAKAAAKVQLEWKDKKPGSTGANAESKVDGRARAAAKGAPGKGIAAEASRGKAGGSAADKTGFGFGVKEDGSKQSSKRQKVDALTIKQTLSEEKKQELEKKQQQIGKTGGPTTVEVAPGPPDVARVPLNPKPAGVPTPYPNTPLTPLDRPTVAQPVQRPELRQPVLRPVELPQPVRQPQPVLQPVQLPQPVKAPQPVLQPAPVKLQPLPMPVQSR